jgi:hypothetical protein
LCRHHPECKRYQTTHRLFYCFWNHHNFTIHQAQKLEMRVSAKVATVLRNSNPNNEVRLRFSNKMGAVEMTEKCCWERLNKDVLRLVASHVSEMDREQMRLVCRTWAKRVSVTDNDAEKITRGRTRKRAQRRAKTRRIFERLVFPISLFLCCLAAAALPVGIIFVARANVPDSFGYVDLHCTFDSPLVVVIFEVRRSCCKGCSEVVRFKGAISVNNATAAVQDMSVCAFDTPEKARAAALGYTGTRSPSSVPCLTQMAPPISVDDVASVDSAAVFQRALLLDRTKQAYMNDFAIAVVVLCLCPMMLLLGLRGMCRIPAARAHGRQ